MSELPTEYEDSDGKRNVIREMPFTHLMNSLRVRLARDGEDDLTVRALQQEADRRVAEGGGAETRTLAPASDRRVAKTDNRPDVDDKVAFEERLNEEHQKLLAETAMIDAEAARLPKPDEIVSDEQVAAIDEWIRRATAIGRDAEKRREAAKRPWLLRGQVVDDFFGGIKKTLKSRIEGLEARKKPYLLAKAAREQAERNARAEAERKAAAEQRAKEEAARIEADRAERERQQKERDLAKLAAEKEAQEASAYAQAEADETEADLSGSEALSDDVDAAEHDLRQVQGEVFVHEDRAELAGRAADAADRRADDAERAAAAPTHTLAKVGESGLKSVWKHRIVSPRTFGATLGPLYDFLPEGEITKALERAAKADPRPTIPGVEFFEDFDVTTNTRTRASSYPGDPKTSF